MTAIGYSNAVESYLPTQAMIDSDEAGFVLLDGSCCYYEGATSFVVYGLPGPFSRGPLDPKSRPGIEDEFLGAIAALRDGKLTETKPTPR